MSAQNSILISQYASQTQEEILKHLQTSASGLTSAQAHLRIKRDGHNTLKSEPKVHILIQFLSRFKDPLIIILAAVALISFVMGQFIDACIVLAMIILSATLNFFQEYKASQAAAKLKQRIASKSMVWRDQKLQEITTALICIGDIVELNAGDLIPADCRILSAKNCFVNQSALTGESMPAAKQSESMSSKSADISNLHNIVFAGTSIVSGTAKVVVVAIANQTQFGKIALSITDNSQDNNFTIGIKKFSAMILKIIILFVLFIFLVNSLIKGNIWESLAFSVAVAVGLTPEFLPMIMSVTMSRGSMHMAKKGVIVKKLTAIPSFGSMDVLCTDKTGTLTQDHIVLVRCIDTLGNDSDKVLLHAYLNSYFQTGISNPMDKAVIEHKKVDIKQYRKIDEIPFDFERKKMSVIVESQGQKSIITKGAPEEILKSCTCFENGEACHQITVAKRLQYIKTYQKLSSEGFRVLAVASKPLTQQAQSYSKADEFNMHLLGFTAFLDPAKIDAKGALEELRQLGVQVKIITGDNELVAAKICKEVGIETQEIVLGCHIRNLSDVQLQKKVEQTTIFARFSPDEKNRVIAALRANGHVVGYMGDGINDAPSLQTADIGISVSNAVDVAKESADIILTHKNLHQLKDGVIEGRKTFSNTLKYIMMGLSSNFGNMFSVLGAVLFLPFLPMLPIQILLNNFLYDFSQLTIPNDQVDIESIQKPKKWDLNFIRHFMLVLGPVSSIFDFLTFFILYHLFSNNSSAFQTGWFMESLATQTLVIYIIRTKKIPLIQSRPGHAVIFSTLATIVIGWLIPYTIIGSYFSFQSLPLHTVGILLTIVVLYLFLAEVVKQLFYRFAWHEVESES